MLNRKEFVTEQFSTEAAPAMAVSPSLLKEAANDAAVRTFRRSRRQAQRNAGQVGGWKLRMW